MGRWVNEGVARKKNMGSQLPAASSQPKDKRDKYKMKNEKCKMIKMATGFWLLATGKKIKRNIPIRLGVSSQKPVAVFLDLGIGI